MGSNKCPKHLFSLLTAKPLQCGQRIESLWLHSRRTIGQSSASSLTPISRKWSLRHPSPSSPHLQACGRGSEKSRRWNRPDPGEWTRWQDERGTRGWKKETEEKMISAARLSDYTTSSESRP